MKIRGFRVEPAEAERVLRAHTAVADVAVVPYERAPGDLALAAYVVAAEGAAVRGAELRAHAAARLPPAMVPAAWVPMRQLPLTGNGKLDRRQLPEPGREHLPEPGATAAPPESSRAACRRCFEKVLELERVGVEDDFFELGGHSLLAVGLFAELERVCG